MPRKTTLVLFLITLILAFLGCAGTMQSRGKTYLKQGKYEEAIKSFLIILQKNQAAAGVWRDLGIAYYKKGEYEKAQTALERAYQLKPEDGSTIFYLGATHEKKQEYREAISYYRQYAQLSRFSKMRSKIEARLEWLTRELVRQEVRQSLANEANLDVRKIPENSIAVLYFQNLGGNPDLDPLQKGLTDMLITDLSQVKKLSVVERVKLQKLLEEIGLGMSGIVDERTAPRLGKLLGASKLIKGSFLDLDQENIRIDAGMVKTASGEYQTADNISGDLEQFFRLEKELVFNIIDEMGITLSEEERQAILVIPTESLLAFLAYSKGLDYEDRGDFSQAHALYQQAVSIDPGFNMAKNKMEQTEQIESASSDLSAIEPQTATESEAATELDTRARLESSMTKIDAGFIPSIDSREAVVEQSNTTTFGSGVPVEIRVKIPR
ncbi:MAG: hypothetical protein Kow0042_32020 [Calditrichia bacterium]